MKINSCSVLVFFCAVMQMHAASNEPSPGTRFIAERLNEQISVDGILSESTWHRPGFTHFVQQDPDNEE